MALNYLTVQDVIWLNTQITGTPQTFDYARLEDGVFYQYGYGNSHDVPAQATRFVAGLAKKQAFAAGNRATALAASLAFAAVNGYGLDGDATAWAERGEGKVVRVEEDEHHFPAPALAAQDVLAQYGDVIRAVYQAESQQRMALQPAP